MRHDNSPAGAAHRGDLPAPRSGVAAHAGSGMISRSTAAAVRRVLHALRDGWLPEDHLRRAAQMIAADARRHDLRAEQMVVALKSEWPTLADVRRAPDAGDARVLAGRLVTLSIHAFYARRASGGAGTPACAVHACRHN